MRVAGSRVVLALFWLGFALAPPLCANAASPTSSPRERILLDTDWRFHKGDPAGATGLDYDVRPDVAQSADGKDADARPDEAAKVTATDGARVLKPWILPTANPLIRDPAKHHVRPAGNPGGDVSFVQAGFDDSGWQRVTLPHDWAIAGPFLEDGPYGGMGRLQTWGPAWYRRTLDIPARDAGRSIFLDVDGAMSYATVWLNGQLVGGWPYGYNGWRVDLTPYVKPGRANQLAIRLDNPPESARWYPGSGLYRNVWLVKSDPVHIAHWGTRVTTPQVSKESATIALEVSIDNDSPRNAEVTASTDVFELDANGERRGSAVARIDHGRARIPKTSSATLAASTTLANPRLWGPLPTQQPNRYVAVTTVSRGGRAIDRVETPFGIRTIRFDANEGFFVNGERIAIRGVNNHHDLGALGSAFNVRAAQRQLDILREMGANAVRMAHNPPAPELLELTDRMGILVVDEVFDSWERKKTPLEFRLVFPDWHVP
ncbi:MAG TPA: glycoside hydrolase family 2 TIM barrel-domain containing protein, partial [Lysobacter sp.]